MDYYGLHEPNQTKPAPNPNHTNCDLVFEILLISVQFYSLRRKIKINIQDPKRLKKPSAETAFSWKIMTSRRLRELRRYKHSSCLMQHIARFGGFFPIIFNPFSTCAGKPSRNISLLCGRRHRSSSFQRIRCRIIPEWWMLFTTVQVWTWRSRIASRVLETLT